MQKTFQRFELRNSPALSLYIEHHTYNTAKMINLYINFSFVYPGFIKTNIHHFKNFTILSGSLTHAFRRYEAYRKNLQVQDEEGAEMHAVSQAVLNM